MNKQHPMHGALAPEERLAIDALRKARLRGCESERALGKSCSYIASWDDFCAACMAEVALHDWAGEQ